MHIYIYVHISHTTLIKGLSAAEMTELVRDVCSNYLTSHYICTHTTVIKGLSAAEMTELVRDASAWAFKLDLAERKSKDIKRARHVTCVFPRFKTPHSAVKFLCITKFCVASMKAEFVYY
jgi:hypothetical protein